jgi:hypothetical protein
LQIAHIFLRLLELGSLLKDLAQAYEATPIQPFGNLKNPARAGLDASRIASAISAFQLTLWIWW